MVSFKISLDILRHTSIIICQLELYVLTDTNRRKILLQISDKKGQVQEIQPESKIKTEARLTKKKYELRKNNKDSNQAVTENCYKYSHLSNSSNIYWALVKVENHTSLWKWMTSD